MGNIIYNLILVLENKKIPLVKINIHSSFSVGNIRNILIFEMSGSPFFK